MKGTATKEGTRGDWFNPRLKGGLEDKKQGVLGLFSHMGK